MTSSQHHTVTGFEPRIFGFLSADFHPCASGSCGRADYFLTFLPSAVLDCNDLPESLVCITDPAVFANIYFLPKIITAGCYTCLILLVLLLHCAQHLLSPFFGFCVLPLHFTYIVLISLYLVFLCVSEDSPLTRCLNMGFVRYVSK